MKRIQGIKIWLTILVIITGGAVLCQKYCRLAPTIPIRYKDAATQNFSRHGGLLYLDKKPFSGWQFAMYGNGDSMYVTPFYAGREWGTARAWYANGQPRSVRLYKNGKKDGLQKGWWPDGKIKFIYHCKADMFEGNVREWYPNGQMCRNMNYVAGQEQGRENIWLEDGRLFANYQVRNGRDYGLTGTNHCNNIWKNDLP